MLSNLSFSISWVSYDGFIICENSGKCLSSSAWVSDQASTSNENSHLHTFQMKFRSEKHGNSCNFYRETVKPQQDPTLTCAICVLSWATFIFSMFSVKDTCFEWMFLPWPIPSSHPEKKGPVKGQDCHMNSSPLGQSLEEVSALWLSHDHGKKTMRFFSGSIFCYSNRSTDTRLHGISAHHSSDHV